VIANSLAAKPNDEAGERMSRCVLTGREQFAAGRTAEAAATYRDGLAFVAGEPAGSVPVEIVSDLHANLANALMPRLSAGRGRQLQGGAAAGPRSHRVLV